MKVASSGAEGAGWSTTDEPDGCDVVRDLLMRFVSEGGESANVNVSLSDSRRAYLA
jgi:hypothetical protein